LVARLAVRRSIITLDIRKHPESRLKRNLHNSRNR